MDSVRNGLSIPDILNGPMTPPDSPTAKRRRGNQGQYLEIEQPVTLTTTAQSTPPPTESFPTSQPNALTTSDSDSTATSVEEQQYPVHDALNDETRRQLDRFCIVPPAQIRHSASHVAFNSDKRDFFSKTGRHGFEAFTYTFRYSEPAGNENESRSLNNDTEWAIMWDYKVGLVRIANLFKWQTNYSKVMPQRALAATPGLKELCHNITGGKTNCQGFWIPFEAAKALAATFCWKIRHALVPMFGQDFVDQCVPPEDAGFRKNAIDPSIIRRCNEQANLWKRLARSYRFEPMRQDSDPSESAQEQTSISSNPDASTPPAQQKLKLAANQPSPKRKRQSQSPNSGLEASRGKEVAFVDEPPTTRRKSPKRLTASRAKGQPQHQNQATGKKTSTQEDKEDEQMKMREAASILVQLSRDAHAQEAAVPGSFSWVNEPSMTACGSSSSSSNKRSSPRKKTVATRR